MLYFWHTIEPYVHAGCKVQVALTCLEYFMAVVTRGQPERCRFSDFDDRVYA